MTARGLGGGFWRMYTATACSDLADGIGRAALPLAAATYTRDPVAVSGLLTFAFLPWLLCALPSGVLVDRVDRRFAMAGANAARALAIAALVAILVGHAGGVVALYVVAFVLGVAETVYDSAVRALLPQVVAAEHLDSANGLVTVEESLGQTFLGAPLGSALFALAIALPFVLNAIGFAIAALIILSLRGGYRPARTVRATVRADIAQGVRWLRGHPLLRGLTVISAGCAFSNAMVNGVFVLYVLEVLHLPSGDYGLVLLAGGVGGVVGSLAVPRLAVVVGRRATLVIGGGVSGLSTATMALTSNGYLAAVLFGVTVAGVMAWNILTMTMRQALIPQELFGRVQGAYRTLVWGGIPLGSLVGGALADILGVRWVLAVAGALLLALAAALNRLLRRQLPDLVTTADARHDAATLSHVE